MNEKTRQNKPDDQVDSPEEKPSSTPTKRLWFFIAGLVLLFCSSIGYWLWARPSKVGVVSVTPTPPASAQPAVKKLVVISHGFALKLVDPGIHKLEDLYTPDAAARSEICQVAGCEVGGSMSIDLSPDNSKVAMDGLAEAGKRMVGYFDIKTKKIVTLAHGSEPHWSPDGKRLAYYDEQGVKAIALVDGKVVTIENTKPTVDQEGVMRQLPDIWGWKSNTEIVFKQGDPDTAKFNIGNINTLKNTAVVVAGLRDEDSIRAAVLSMNGQKLLLGIDLGAGYDVGVVGVDGKGFARITGNQASRWPGSGYSAAAFSPGLDRALVINNFIPADGSVKRSSGEYEIHGLTGQKIGSVAGYRGLSDFARACWFSPNLIYLAYSTDSGKNYLGAYDVAAGKMTQLGELDVYSQITCAP